MEGFGSRMMLYSLHVFSSLSDKTLGQILDKTVSLKEL